MWKDFCFNGHPTNYECSDNGEIRNKNTKRILKANLKKTGYLEYELYIDGIGVWLLGHRIIAQTFLDNPLNLNQVNHKNGIKTDNRVANLEWCSSQFNNQHAWDNGLNSAEKIRVEIQQYTVEGKLVATYESIAQAKRKTGFNNINKVLSGERQTCGGYYWRYSDDRYIPKKVGRKKKVGQFSLDGNFIAEFDSASQASRETGCYRKGIVDCCNGVIKQSKGFLWRYL